jgi:sulfatase maturation enzyme AslB (radical SAM superfamily)
MLEKTFCSSPWFHVRLGYNGTFQSCRWGNNSASNHSIHNQTILQFYNSEQMRQLRMQLLTGEIPDHCSDCYYEESFGKLNGRIRQLNKSAIDLANFSLTLRSSPHYKNFEYSLNNHGAADLAPTDLQVDLGNTCNSACIMCVPEASSRLEKDYIKLHQINPTLFDKPNRYKSWTKDPQLVQQFVNEVLSISSGKYIHFLGGETLYEESFYNICDQLIENNLASNMIIGTTTNGTIFNPQVQKYIENFKQFHLGISIESVTKLNDYIRWPGKIDEILKNINKFLSLRNNNPGLQISLRITPNIFSIYELDQLFEFMIENNVIAESCNILSKPDHLRMELIPEDIRLEIQEKFRKLVDKHKLQKQSVTNIRRSDKVNDVISNVILDYYNFILTYKAPETLESSRHNLIDFLKAFEILHKNSILDYAPRYEKFLRSYGY